MFSNAFILFAWEGHMSSVKLLQDSAAGKEEKCHKFKFFASYHYIPISLSTVQLQQILNLTLSSFLAGKRGVDVHLGNTHWAMPRILEHECLKSHLTINP